jgi:hypothetical protein
MVGKGGQIKGRFGWTAEQVPTSSEYRCGPTWLLSSENGEFNFNFNFELSEINGAGRDLESWPARVFEDFEIEFG